MYGTLENRDKKKREGGGWLSTASIGRESRTAAYAQAARVLRGFLGCIVDTPPPIPEARAALCGRCCTVLVITYSTRSPSQV